jgi:hypothetical protein
MLFGSIRDAVFAKMPVHLGGANLYYAVCSVRRFFLMANQYCSQCGSQLAEQVRFCGECGAAQSGQPHSRPQTELSGSRFSLPVLLLVAGVLLLIGGAVVYLFDRPAAAPEVVNAPTNVVESDIPYPEVGRISVAETKARADAGTAVILDVRPREDYVTLHAANAISIPLTEINDRFPELPQDVEILTYCT